MVIQTKCLAVQCFFFFSLPWRIVGCCCRVCHGLIILRPAPLFTGGNAGRVRLQICTQRLEETQKRPSTSDKNIIIALKQS